MEDSENSNYKDSSSFSVKTKIGYSLGHVYNDFCGSFWFTYLIVYMQNVAQLNYLQAGIIMFFGQLCDALANTFSGILCDRTRLKYYGRRKFWHLIGTVFVTISFPLIFNLYPGKTMKPGSWVVFSYYMIAVMVFQTGWCFVQLAHMALIPDLTSDNRIRVQLNSIRYAMTVVSNLFVYALFFILFYLVENNSKKISPKSSKIFMYGVIIVTVTGLICSILFHILTSEKTESEKSQITNKRENLTILSQNTSDDNDDKSEAETVNLSMSQKLEHPEEMNWYDWFKVGQFYQVTFCYALSRLLVNGTQVYVSLYSLIYLGLRQNMLAILPFVIFFAAFISTFATNALVMKIGSKLNILIGSVMCILLSIWIYFINNTITSSSKIAQIVVVCCILGAGSTSLLVSSLALANELIGHHINNGSFVLGTISFVDKLANGILVLILQNVFQFVKKHDKDVGLFYKYVMIGVPAFCGAHIVLLYFTLMKTEVGVFKIKKSADETNSYTKLSG